MTGPQLTPGLLAGCREDRGGLSCDSARSGSPIFYRTGDRVRRGQGKSRPMVYLGRMDNQIKIQGYRVELGEIEAVIREEAGVEVAIALGWPITSAGADSVVVFVSDPEADLSLLTQRAKARLPAYMAPREIRHIDTFPLNSNGKVDRGALRALLEGD